MHLDTIGIYFVVGYLVGSDLYRIFYWIRRARQADQRIEELLRRRV